VSRSIEHANGTDLSLKADLLPMPDLEKPSLVGEPQPGAATSYPLEKIKVVLLEGVHPIAADRLAHEGYSVTRLRGSLEGDDLLEAAADAHLIGIRSKTHLTRNFFDNARRLWGVGCFCIGTNQVDLEAAAEHGVAVFNAPFANTRSVAELTVAETVALHRRLFERSMELHQGRWRKSASGAHEVRGRTLGIVGYGRIGSQVSVLAEAMGMRVLYHDVVDTLPLGNAAAAGSLHALLEQSDVVTLHVPATRETEWMIGEKEIARMKEGAFLINNARGNVVDLDALADALRSGRLAGAAVDVYPAEPRENDAPFESPLSGIPNVILSPHIGGSTIEAQRSIAEETSLKLAKLMNNGSTTGAVNVPEVELPMLHPDHHRILHFHRNVPGVLSRLHRMLGDLGVNIAAEHLQSDPKHGYVILDIEPTREAEVKEGLHEIEETIRVRTLW
jgi:D-3-phosphoglycerate dehydrogenase